MTTSMEMPDALLGRLRLGREEYCQRLLTMLILGGTYPRWNTRNHPVDSGYHFLSLLEDLSFGETLCEPPYDFVDELDLGKRPQDLKGSAPDWAVFTHDRVWIIELKTERGSHRPAQVPTYVATGRHYYPDLHVDLTYLTGPMPSYQPDLPDGTRYAHVTWERVLPLVQEVWGDDGSDCAAVVTRLREVTQDLTTRWSDWRGSRVTAGQAASRGEAPPAAEAARGTTADEISSSWSDAVEQALALARRTADDHRQRAVDHHSGSLEELREVGRATLEAMRADSHPGLSHVVPWLWNLETSGGAALTASGSEVGYELRLSWYQSPQR